DGDDEFVFSEEELAEAQADFDQACREFASGQYAKEFKALKGLRPQILQKVKERIDRLEAEKISSRRHGIAQYEAIPSDPPPGGEIERSCLEAVEGDTKRLRMPDVRIFDCTLREGAGLLRGVLSREERVWLARQIQGLGVDILEV